MTSRIPSPKLCPLFAELATCALLLGTSYLQAQSDITDVHVYDFDFGTAAHSHFDPIIAVGDTVRWVWDTGNVSPHSTTAASGQLETWNSGLQTAPFTFDHTFTQPGVFNYYCLLHGFDAGGGLVGGMSGHVTVVAVPEPAAASILLASLGVLRVFRARHPCKRIRKSCCVCFQFV